MVFSCSFNFVKLVVQGLKSFDKSKIRNDFLLLLGSYRIITIAPKIKSQSKKIVLNGSKDLMDIK